MLIDSDCNVVAAAEPREDASRFWKALPERTPCYLPKQTDAFWSKIPDLPAKMRSCASLNQPSTDGPAWECAPTEAFDCVHEVEASSQELIAKGRRSGRVRKADISEDRAQIATQIVVGIVPKGFAGRRIPTDDQKFD